jgi:hypothetical protein
MSRNSHWLELQRKISEIDARFDAEKTFEFVPATASCNAVSRHWELYREHRHPYLCQIYWTGAVPRRDVGSLAVREAVRETIPIPDELLAKPPSIGIRLTIPHELLCPKPKRGRPRNEALRSHANDLRCSLRHSRRLLATRKPRQRDRERQSDDVLEALQARKTRTALVREMKAEAVMSYLSFAISYLSGKKFTVTKVDSKLARKLVKHEKELAPAVLIVTIAMGSKSFHNAAKLLGVSQATIYRNWGSRLDEFRRRGRDLVALAVVDLKKMANMKLPKRKRGVVSRPDNAWEMLEQTLFPQRYEHHDW